MPKIINVENYLPHSQVALAKIGIGIQNLAVGGNQMELW